jgi:hypothetical protein
MSPSILFNRYHKVPSSDHFLHLDSQDSETRAIRENMAAVNKEHMCTLASPLEGGRNTSVGTVPSNYEGMYKENHDKFVYGHKSFPGLFYERSPPGGKCPYCDYRSTDLSKVFEQICVCLGVPLWQCPCCLHGANKKSSMESHIASQHPGIHIDRITLLLSVEKLLIHSSRPSLIYVYYSYYGHPSFTHTSLLCM